METKGNSAPILVTGVAGFIGYHLAKRLLSESVPVIGIDNLNDYYDVSLKEARLALLKTDPKFEFRKVDIGVQAEVERLFEDYEFESVIHLAAQAGVRYSLTNPQSYVSSNLVGFVNILESVRHKGCSHFVFASSSSVYGANTKVPFAETDRVDFPVSLYAATKKSNEVIAHAYSHLFEIPTTGLRFFTVYGPYGRPDMAIFKFTKAIISGDPIEVYQGGELERDFTYIDDIVEGIVRSLRLPPQPRQSPEEWTHAPYRLLNIGGSNPVKVKDLVTLIEKKLGVKANVNWAPMQPGDVYKTYADTSDISMVTGFTPVVGIEEGVGRFIDWYREFYC